MSKDLNDNLMHISLRKIIPDSLLIDDLWFAGYRTAGDVLNANPDDIARDVKGMGPKRALALRDKVHNTLRLKVMTDTVPVAPKIVPPGDVSWSVVEPDHRPTYRINDVIVTVGMVMGLAMMFYFFARLVLGL